MSVFPLNFAPTPIEFSYGSDKIRIVYAILFGTAIGTAVVEWG